MCGLISAAPANASDSHLYIRDVNKVDPKLPKIEDFVPTSRSFRHPELDIYLVKICSSKRIRKGQTLHVFSGGLRQGLASADSVDSNNRGFAAPQMHQNERTPSSETSPVDAVREHRMVVRILTINKIQMCQP